MIDAGKPKHFLLVGNGPYSNRGCEAIVRGTMVILRHEFGDNIRVTLGTFESPEIVSKQSSEETDPLISHISLQREPLSRWSLSWWYWQFSRVLFLNRPYSMLDQYCNDQTVGLQVGGDNFTLDYGRPIKYMRLNDYLIRSGMPVILWGASVGPFEEDIKFAPRIFANLHAMRAIFVRESHSHEYLRSNKFASSLYRMSDPAFLMEPVEPIQQKIGYPNSLADIGLNLSPLMAKYITGGDLTAWVKIAAEIVQCIIKTTNRNVVLIPHVTWAQTNDYTFLCDVVECCAQKNIKNVFCVSDKLSAAEIKWVISRCTVFAGARTHATIAAISTHVPTLSLAYSRKASGLNNDIFGNQDYCFQPNQTTPSNVAKSIADLLENRESIRNQLAIKIPKIQENALQSGALLRKIIEKR
jgi:colanic acid/amylovoran biosynthesis protein